MEQKMDTGRNVGGREIVILTGGKVVTGVSTPPFLQYITMLKRNYNPTLCTLHQYIFLTTWEAEQALSMTLT